ncbi:MAG TPA: D-aminoacylase, partial [Candidatus Handelsmanbacteria bacterium]|nr:D-aminoacylase [Candidatus Handelsmanbacteria bacterium]
MFALVISGGTVIDGTATPRKRADVGVSQDRIAAIADDLSGAETGRRIDASGKIVTPGFVDVHNHSDAWLRKIPHLIPKTAQGFTTEVIMADGISYAPLNDETAPEWIYYMRSLNALLFEGLADGFHIAGDGVDLDEAAFNGDIIGA